MSGDVQPRKRKDKKRKKDDLSVEEPRGTAAVFGEGDVFMHSQHEHGTGGHWCAKVIFFSLLAVLITLIGLIILENRGLTELEANSVETPYSRVLEGWLEDAPDDDHHDEHTLELLKQHDNEIGHDDEEHSQEVDQDSGENTNDQDDEHEEDDELDDVDDHEESDEIDESEQDSEQQDEEDNDHDQDDDDEDHEEADDQDDEDSEEQNTEEADEDDDEPAYNNNIDSDEDQKEDDNDDDDEIENDLQKLDDNDSVEDNDDDDDDDDDYDKDDQNDEDGDDIDQSIEKDNYGNDDNNYDKDDQDDDGIEQSIEKDDDENEQDENETRETEEKEEQEDEDVDSGVEVEKLEKEISDEDIISAEEPAQDESEDDKSQENSNEVIPEDDVDSDEEEYLELEDIDEPLPVVEHIKVPAGKPLTEVEEDTSSEKPVDTLAEEEEYEKQQEQLRREQAQASHMWLKLVVGGALLVATHAVVRRATAARDTPASDEHAVREDTPLVDRRMTLIPEGAAVPAPSKEALEEIVEPVVEEFLENVSSTIKSSAPVQLESEEEEDDDVEEIEIDIKDDIVEEPGKKQETKDKELYSDEEETEDEEVEEEEIAEKEETPKQRAPVVQKQTEAKPKPEPEPEEEVPDDVEIIDDEQLEEEQEEENEDEEEISDVDDAELLSRLEAKYGRLPEPERPQPKHKDGGNSIEDDWPGEPSDAYWRQQLDQAEQELRQGEWNSASTRASAAELAPCARARWLTARALDAAAEARRDNGMLTRAIAAYLELLKMNDRLSDKKLLLVAERTLDRIRFRGNYLSAEPVYRLLIRRFPDDAQYRNNLTVSYLMANRADLAGEVIKETLKRWPDDRIALAHHGFVLKTHHNRLEEAVDAFQKALKGDVGPATEPRFYYHLGDALLLLGRYAEAHEVHKRGAALGHFLSPAQRSLYNVDRLQSRPWWNIEQTPYSKLARALERSWKEILKEGEAARSLYEKEKEGLKERGEWSQLDMFVRGQEIPNRCKTAPVTCAIVRAEAAAAGCRRGQIKFSSMEAGTHVRPHVGPTNCRLRMHLGLSNTKDTYIRVDQETRQWQTGKVFMFDDSFEHEVWHNGTGTRLVLIVDVWHPDLTPAERRSLPAI